MSGTSHTSAAAEFDSRPRGLADAANVLVLEDRRASARNHRCPGVATDGPLLLVAFTGADVRRLERRPGTGRERYVVDATPQGVAAEADADRLAVESASAPSNLTEVGVALDKLLDRAGDADGRLDCCLPSLTALLQYVDRQRGYRFCNAVANRLASADAFAHYHLTTGAHEGMTVDTFASLMDAVVRVDDDGARVVRRR
ncbi:DUF7504 family protein [Halorarum salinum]|uniref:Uncharacterized protein n=1 Tax=Halorarum salinum TaxID=2743089 RepID=A0A7D5LE51_9EURY|nr:hypothetical protein [Halobaculum salinum]QLG63869.1 hypothetical protein HUG12_19950 [Halobaculum salinum]